MSDVSLEAGKSPLFEVRKVDFKSSNSTNSVPVPEKSHEQESSISCKNDVNTGTLHHQDNYDSTAIYTKKGKSKVSSSRRSPVHVYTYQVYTEFHFMM